MTINDLNTRLRNASNAYATDRANAMRYEDDNLTPQGLHLARLEKAAAARTAYKEALSGIRAGYNVAADANLRALEKMPATSAKARDGWDRAKMLLDAGRPLSEVIRRADRDMLDGIREWGPTYLETINGPHTLGEAIAGQDGVDLAPLNRSIRARYTELTGDHAMRDALAAEPDLAALGTALHYAEQDAADSGRDHGSIGLRAAVAADLARQAAALDLAAAETSTRDDQ